MLRQTLIHIRGVGHRTEARLWRSGIQAWGEFRAVTVPARLPRPLALRIQDELVRSTDALRRGRQAYFAASLPSAEHWRARPEFRDAIAYLDIETTGWSVGRDAFTVVGPYDGRRRTSFLQGRTSTGCLGRSEPRRCSSPSTDRGSMCWSCVASSRKSPGVGSCTSTSSIRCGASGSAEG